MDITKLIKIIDSTGDEVNAQIEGKEVGKDDNGNTVVETETEDGDTKTITLDKDNNPVDTIKDDAEPAEGADGKESGIRMIWHGEWADPELTDGSRTVNYWDVEDDLWDKFRADGGEDDMSAFHEWRSAHPEEVEASFNLMADAMADAEQYEAVGDSKIGDSDFTDYDTQSVAVKIEGNNNIEYMDAQEFAQFRKACKKDGTKYEVVKDSADIPGTAEFAITEDNVYDLIQKGSTSVAIPSGVDTDAFVAAVEDIIKDVASDCGYGKLAINTEINGNMLNIIKK